MVVAVFCCCVVIVWASPRCRAGVRQVAPAWCGRWPVGTPRAHQRLLPVVPCLLGLIRSRRPGVPCTLLFVPLVLELLIVLPLELLIVLVLECRQLLLVLPQQPEGSLLLPRLELTVALLLQRRQCYTCYVPHLWLPALAEVVASARVCGRCSLSCPW